MYYVYILKSLTDLKLYIGRSNDLKRRISEHHQGKVQATCHRRPLELISYEAFRSKGDSTRREKYFKTSKGKSTLKLMLRDSLK